MFFRTIDGGTQKLWEDGVIMWDEYSRQHFNLKAIIFYWINDNPTCLPQIGQVKGKMGCVVYVDQTESIYLPSSRKLVYMRHHILLPHKHKYHQWRTQFDGTIKNEEAPKHRDGKFVFKMIKNINIVFGKPMKGKRGQNKKAPKDSSFKKQSIFFRYLPYWKEFKIGHSIDTKHVTKGVFESTISLLLDIPGKMKDGLNACKDVEVHRIREELDPQERSNGKVYLPPASYTLTNEEKRAICKCLRGIRVPIGFSINIKNLVSMSELEVSGYNTHDCLTMLSLFLPLQLDQSIIHI
jgi:hypothetical protein